MKSAKSKVVFDIGIRNTKIIEVEERHGEYNILKHSMFKTPDDTFEDGVIKNSNRLAEIFERELKLRGYRAKNVIATISNPNILSREVVLPKGNLKDMTLLVDIEAPNHFPIDISQYSVDFKLLEEVIQDDISQYKVLLLVTPLNILESYVEVFEKCGLFLEKIDFKGNSITKLVNAYDKGIMFGDPITSAVLDIGCESSSITICNGGLIKYSRAVPYGSNQYNVELTNLLDCSSEVAEQIKFSTGIISSEEQYDDVQYAAKQSWVKFSVPFFDEVTRVFDFYTSRDSTNSIDKILLTGGGALIPNLVSYMHNSFDMDIDFLNCEGAIEFLEPINDFSYFSAYFANCAGAILNE